MSASKNSFFRYRTYDLLFTSPTRQYWTSEEILDRLAEADIFISKRTLAADFHAMRYDTRLAYFAPIHYCRFRKAYAYKKPFSIQKVPLTPELEQACVLATHLVEGCGRNHILTLLLPLLQAIQQVTGPFLNRSPQDNPIVRFDNNLRFQLKDFIHLSTSILDQTVLRIQLVSSCQKHILHPYILREYCNEWYLVGFSEKYGCLACVHLNRIRQIEETDLEYRRRPHAEVSGFEVWTHLLC